MNSLKKKCKSFLELKRKLLQTTLKKNKVKFDELKLYPWLFGGDLRLIIYGPHYLVSEGYAVFFGWNYRIIYYVQCENLIIIDCSQ